MITTTKAEQARYDKERERERAEALRMVFGNQVTFKVSDDGVLTAYRGRRALCTKELSTSFLEKVGRAVQDALRGGQ